MKTTLNDIRAHNPCPDGWRKLLAYLGKTEADDEPLSLLTILDSNGLDDAMWALRAVEGYDREIRLYAVWCARRVEHLLTDQRSLNALEVAERFARGRATREELDAARAAARAARAAWDAWDAWDAWAAWAAGAAAGAAWAAAGAAWAAGAAARVAARAPARAAQVAELRRLCECVDAGVDPYPEEAL